MSSLFIIGNGFDIAHDLKTSYEEFHKYLKLEYPDARPLYDYAAPLLNRTPDGEFVYDEVEGVSVIMTVISDAVPNGEKWSDLENSLGHLNLSEYFEDDLFFDEEDDDYNEWDTVYENEDIASNLIYVLEDIPEYFSKWIDTIDIDKSIPCKKDFKKLIDDDSIFLNFNYTETLENVYDIKDENVYHIHGKQGGKLVFGHGNNEDRSEEYMSSHIGSENALSNLDDILRKDTKKVIRENNYFFDSLTSNIDKIYSFGFSFAEVDQIYIKEICKKLCGENVIWYLNDHDEHKYEEYKKIIRACGFNGEFSTYSVKE